jgi:hypothetical protein
MRDAMYTVESVNPGNSTGVNSEIINIYVMIKGKKLSGFPKGMR